MANYIWCLYRSLGPRTLFNEHISNTSNVYSHRPIVEVCFFTLKSQCEEKQLVLSLDGGGPCDRLLLFHLPGLMWINLDLIISAL